MICFECENDNLYSDDYLCPDCGYQYSEDEYEQAAVDMVDSYSPDND